MTIIKACTKDGSDVWIIDGVVHVVSPATIRAIAGYQYDDLLRRLAEK